MRGCCEEGHCLAMVNLDVVLVARLEVYSTLDGLHQTAAPYTSVGVLGIRAVPGRVG